MKRVRLGSGSSWSRDRLQPAGDLVLRGDIDYLCFDAMSEVTMSITQAAMLNDPNILPYDPYLPLRIRPILKDCVERGVRLITNSGWLDPLAAARKILEIAGELDVAKLKVAVVTGSVLGDRVLDMGLTFIEDGNSVSESRDIFISAEVYLGAEGIIQALQAGADIVVTSRVGDACMYLAALAHEFGWSLDDPSLAAKGMIIGHLLECGSQVSGGCFADPGYKDVPDIANLSNPIAEVTEDKIVITKLPGTGGTVSVATCKEQLLYEVQDPSRYYCPDVVADLTKVTFRQVTENEVEVIIDDAGLPKTPTLKALIGLREGFIAEEMVLFAGPGALNRAELTKQILAERFKKIGLKADEIRTDYIGLSAVHREATPHVNNDPYEIILRIALKAKTREEAAKLGVEVDTLAVNGPAGVGKWGTHSPGTRIRPIVGLNSALVPREQVPFSVQVLDLAEAGIAAA